MEFYLGTHVYKWLAKYKLYFFVSDRVLSKLGKLPIAAHLWALDSGAFSELQMFGRWTVKPRVYVERVRRYSSEIGKLSWAAPQDWMCEPFILQRTGLTVARHQL